MLLCSKLCQYFPLWCGISGCRLASGQTSVAIGSAHLKQLQTWWLRAQELDLTEYAEHHHWENHVFGRHSRSMVENNSVATQIVTCVILSENVRKFAATAVGGGFLLLQVTSQNGYIQVIKKVEKDVNKAKR